MELMDKFDNLMERIGMPEDVSNEVKTFILGVAKEQYLAGNRSGIRWARMNPVNSPSYSS